MKLELTIENDEIKAKGIILTNLGEENIKHLSKLSEKELASMFYHCIDDSRKSQRWEEKENEKIH